MIRFVQYLALLMMLSLTTAGSCDDSKLTGEPCDTNADCDDGLFCNGEEFCSGRVCARLDPPDCDDGIDCTADSCSERLRECVSEPPDADEDGVADRECRGIDGLPLGADCDDSDANRFPGNPELCDVENHDEDCDLETVGDVDIDRDGLVSVNCCNMGPDGLNCGTDCDDSNFSVVHGSQTCDPQTSSQAVLICQQNGAFASAVCGSQGTCIVQPNGLGVCVN